VVNQTKSPCEECIVKMICTSQMNCDRRRNYIRYSIQFNVMNRDIENKKRVAAVDSYFKRFRRSR